MSLFCLRKRHLAALGLFAMVVSLPAQTIITNFAGLTLSDVTALGTGGTPPDTMGAAGTNQFVEFINGGFAIYSKAGVRQSLISDIAFWTNAGISSATISAGLSDTRIIYDAGTARWFATEITVDNLGNNVLVARSDSSNPAGGWKAVSFVANSGFGDYDTLGVDSEAVYVGVNDFTSGDPTATLTGVSFFSIPKTNLLAATPTLANMTKFENLDANTYGFTLQGVCNPAPGAGHGVMVAIDNATLRKFDRTTISNPGGAGATLTGHVQLSNLYDGSPVPATQPGNRTIDTLDDRFSGAVKQVGGYIFMANTVTNTGSPKCAVHWLVMNETNNAIIGEGIITSNNYDFYQPSIAANKNGKMLLGFNRSGSVTTTGDISIYAALGTWSGAGASMGAPFLIKQGIVSNFGVSGDSSPYRWGDFSATMVDPTDDNLFWTIQEIPASSSTWGTQVALISVATNQPALGIARSGTNVMISWPLSTDPAYTLQSNTNLLASNSWTTVSSAQVISINQNVVTLPATNRPVFFRLKK
jgi:hypothetical protein